jgi:hypothetical protein
MQKLLVIVCFGLVSWGCGSAQDDQMGGFNGNAGGPPFNSGEWQPGRSIDLAGAGGKELTTKDIPRPSSTLGCTDGTPVHLEGVSLSTSLASAAVARESLKDDKAPLPAALRPQDFVNYYHFPVPPSGNTGDGPHVTVELKKRNPTDFKGLLDAVVVVHAPPLSERLPANLTVVVDTSASMSGAGIARARAVVSALATNLKSGDRVWLLTTRQAFFDEPATLFEIGMEGTPDLAVIAKSLDVESDIESGPAYLYQNAYMLAEQIFDPSRLNRIFAISDGEGSDEDLDAVYMQAKAESDLRLVGVGVGQLAPDLLRTASRFAAGRYVYVDSLDEASAISSTRFDELTSIAYRHVMLDLEYPNYLRGIGDTQLVVDPATVEPQHLAPGGSMVFPYLFLACNATVVDTDSVTASVAYHDANGNAASPVTATRTLAEAAGPTPLLDKVMAVESYTDALISLDSVRFQKAFSAIDSACLSAAVPDPELKELHELISAHPVFVASPPANPPACLY